MVIVKIMEGLGNQIFEYACGRRLALYKNTELKFDITDYDKPDYPRQYELNAFNILENLARPSEIQKLKGYEPHSGKKGLFYNFFWADSAKYFKEKQIFVYDKSILNTDSDVYIEGYWHSEKYFIDIKDLILSEISLKNPGQEMIKIDKKIKAENSIALHIRRGDYVSNKKTNHIHGTCGNKYYEKAIDYILSTKLVPNPSLYIFSDDIEWAKINFKNRLPIEFVSSDKIKDTEELILMSHCKHNIIANSTFSWWGAWLNTNRDKTVIAPQKWFNNEKVNTSDLIPEKWIRI